MKKITFISFNQILSITSHENNLWILLGNGDILETPDDIHPGEDVTLPKPFRLGFYGNFNKLKAKNTSPRQART